MSYLTFLLSLVLINLINGEEQSSLIFQNNLQLRNEKNSPDSQVLSEDTSLKLPQVINLPKDNQTLVTSTDQIKKKGKHKSPKSKGRVLTSKFNVDSVYLTTVNPDTVGDEDYEPNDEIEEEWSDIETAKQFQQLEDPNSPQNGPIYPLVNGIPKANSFIFMAGDRRPPSLQHLSSAQVSYQQAPTLPTLAPFTYYDDGKKFKGEFTYDDDEEDEATYPPIDVPNPLLDLNVSKSDSLDQIIETEQYTTILPLAQSGYSFIQEQSPEITKPMQKDNQIDYLEEAKKLSVKLDFESKTKEEPPTVYQTEPKSPLPIEKPAYSVYPSKETPVKNEAEIVGLNFPSIYELIKNGLQQSSVANSSLLFNISRPLYQTTQAPIAKASNKIINLLPKIVITKQDPFPSADLFRRGCAIKINGFPLIGVCRTSCGAKEIGIQTKLKETCTSYQLTCNNPFEFCCVPNLSDLGTCNLDLFKPNDILVKVEKSLNLPQNSLIKLSQLPGPFVESVLNYRPYISTASHPYENKFSKYYNLNKPNEINVPRPSIMHTKNAAKKSLRTESEDKNMTDVLPINNLFRSIVNPPIHTETKTSKVLRRVDNPMPFIRNVQSLNEN